MEHPVEIIYSAAGRPIEYGNTHGICRITGKDGVGLLFDKWVKDTFTDHSYLFPGDIVSNAALFCFDEQSVLIQAMTGRDKVQKFRTYSHFVTGDGEWKVFTKADKREMFSLLTEDSPRVVVMSDSGQKHLVFKHRPGMWQLEEANISADVKRLLFLHDHMQQLLEMGFSQKEVISGDYAYHRIFKAGPQEWKRVEAIIAPLRRTGIFDVAAWLLFAPENNENGTTHTTGGSREINFSALS